MALPFLEYGKIGTIDAAPHLVGQAPNFNVSKSRYYYVTNKGVLDTPTEGLYDDTPVTILHSHALILSNQHTNYLFFEERVKKTERDFPHDVLFDNTTFRYRLKSQLEKREGLPSSIHNHKSKLKAYFETIPPKLMSLRDTAYYNTVKTGNYGKVIGYKWAKGPQYHLYRDMAARHS